MIITAIKDGTSYYGNMTKIAKRIGMPVSTLQRWFREKKQWQFNGEKIPVYKNGYVIYFDTVKLK